VSAWTRAGKWRSRGGMRSLTAHISFRSGSSSAVSSRLRKEAASPGTGGVTDANVDITAIYTVKASALDLVQDQLAGLSRRERNKYKQMLPIQVYLTMDGKLLAPNIHFRLDLLPEGRGVLGDRSTQS